MATMTTANGEARRVTFRSPASVAAILGVPFGTVPDTHTHLSESLDRRNQTKQQKEPAKSAT